MNVASVSYLNAKPLIYGLGEAKNIHLTLDVPAKLIDGMRDGRFDIALLPIIDVQRLENVRILTSGGIGCDGPTLTVRIFSKVPVDQIQMLACDTHSHSSVALARVILAEAYGLRPEFTEFDPFSRDPEGTPAGEREVGHDALPCGSTLRVAAKRETILLIGDKVVCEEPSGFPYQLDLGEAWKKLTGLPFVFAAWVARGDLKIGDVPDQLRHAKEEGMKHLSEIVETHAIPRGWPAELAMRYMTQYLKYDIGDRQIQAIRHFHQLAARHGMIEKPVKELNVVY